MDLKWLDLWWTSSNWGMSPNDCEVFRHMAQVALAGALHWTKPCTSWTKPCSFWGKPCAGLHPSQQLASFVQKVYHVDVSVPYQNVPSTTKCVGMFLHGSREPPPYTRKKTHTTGSFFLKWHRKNLPEFTPLKTRDEFLAGFCVE